MDIKLRLPLPEEQIFRYKAMDDILELTAQNPSTEFGNRDLQEMTGFGGPSVSKALSLLESMDLVIRRDSGNKTFYRINEQRLQAVDDPFLEIPQKEFREPLRRFIDRTNETIASVAGIVCFGSVARGEADRVSDIDLFVLVDDDTELVTARRTISDIMRELESEPIEGQRYEFEVFVESPESARRRGEDLQPIFQKGIILEESAILHEVKRDLFGGENE
ncbi:nucleotidyltransferase domain-containing protein [Natronococcus sp. A-GB7]|uniref:nucleotidyltransferase domain-containing protein n=1 Tax=Natronococcus sp. A-GB7 TaxID=3037649 RepID=UPI00241F38C3|nr:nucleotidyltransferase domain-containing protein [Natronococcus sp. A-GB7]MDG5820782.1 nucleotidyltransferase domain-containing protein [Natronococcus sp. A-GB7]